MKQLSWSSHSVWTCLEHINKERPLPKQWNDPIMQYDAMPIPNPYRNNISHFTFHSRCLPKPEKILRLFAMISEHVTVNIQYLLFFECNLVLWSKQTKSKLGHVIWFFSAMCWWEATGKGVDQADLLRDSEWCVYTEKRRNTLLPELSQRTYTFVHSL